VGVASLAVGGIFGVRALTVRDDADRQCRGGTCNADAVQRNSDANSAATVANIGMIAGIVGVGAGSYLLARSAENERRAWGIVGVGAGVVALGVGSFFGLRALDKRSDSNAQCASGACTPAGGALLDEAKAAAWTSDVALGLGLVMAGAGTYLLVTSGAPRSPSSARLGVAPTVIPGGAGSLLTGAW
jgi:serine/threonine-protein kinase